MRRTVSAYTPAKDAVRQQAWAAGLFIPTGRAKIACAVCLSTGYPGGSWMDKHIEGHVGCVTCGKQYTTKTINLHWSKSGHVDQRSSL